MTSELETEWEPQEPPPRFAERVVAAAMREQRPSRRRTVIAVAAVAVAAAAIAIVATNRSAAPSRGDVSATARIEVPIGTRAVAVLEPGARITWSRNIVEQTRGDVFYRVEPGTEFSVRTPNGAEAVVLGTCFRISLEKENVMKRRDFGAGALGAVVAAVVVVGVYEGKVRVSHGKEAVTVAAGERAVADSSGVRAEQPTRTTKADDTTATRTTAELRDRIATIEKEKADLEQELVAAHEDAAKPTKSPYDLTPDDWAKLAEEGTFKYQIPCFQKDGFRPTTAQLDRLGLDPGSADAIQKAYKNANKRFAMGARELCKTQANTEVEHCLSRMFTSLYTDDKAREMYTLLAEIRAGKRPEPADPDAHLRLLLLFSGQMTGFEEELAKTFGAEEAHRLAYSEDMCFQANTMR